MPESTELHETGNPQIDGQHRRMAEILRALRATASADPKDPALDGQLNELVRLAESHFRDEDALMRVLPDGLKRFGAHIEQHRTLLFELVKLRDELSRRGTGVGPAVLEFLECWFFDHVNTFDREIEDLDARSREPVPWLEPES